MLIIFANILNMEGTIVDTGLSKLEPKLIWNYFEQMCKIPHPSKHEDKIREWVIQAAKELNLEVKTTPVGNVVIQKPATKGMEQRKKITMQAHMDMVPAKLASSPHNFLTDPIKAYIDGEWVTADGTTLGADNGIGVATGFAVLASKDIQHGPLEMLVTTDEEAGMSGAFGLRSEDLSGEILLNLDSEEDHEVCIGCAGGVDTDIRLPITQIKLDKKNKLALKIAVGNLVSGHSGVDIYIGRANANKEIGNLLYLLSKDVSFELAHISGGRLRNVIPAYCEVIIVLDKADKEKALSIIKQFESNFAIEFKGIETKYTISVDDCDLPDSILEPKDTRKFVTALKACFNGLYQMNWDINIPQMSSNLGVIKIENSTIHLTTLQRCPDEYAKYKVAGMVAAPFELIGAEVKHCGAYPGWLPNINSPMLKIVQDSYRQLFNSEIKVSATHGGLECGLILDKAPHMDAVSIGATIRDPHSANERVNIKSVAKVWELVKVILQNTPQA